MPLEPELEKAVEHVVQERQQPNSVAKRLLAWLEELSEAELSTEDQKRHLTHLRDALVVSVENQDAD